MSAAPTLSADPATDLSSRAAAGADAPRILFISFDIRSRFGGIQRFDQRVVRCLGRLKEQGMNVRVLSLRDAPHVPADETTPIEIFGSSGSKPRALRKFMSALMTFRPDLILYGHVLISPLAYFAKFLAPHAKNVMFAHGIEVWDDPAFARVSKLNRRAVRTQMDQILAVSRFTADRMKQVFDIPDDRISIFPNAVDVMPLSQRAYNPQSPQNRRILTVARLDEWEKGVGAVIRAIPQVIQRIPNVEYKIVGDGKLRSDMQMLAAELGVNAHVHFAGKVTDDELNTAYGEADAFVMPSLKEGFGIVYLEAWQHGLPVLAGNRDAGGEVVENDRDGLIVNPISTDQIAEAIVRLLSDPPLRQRLGAAGREKLEREYSHERFAERFEAAIRSLLPAGCADGSAVTRAIESR